MARHRGRYGHGDEYNDYAPQEERQAYYDRHVNEMPECCQACGGPYPSCCDSCPMFDD